MVSISCQLQVFGLNRFRETELIHGRWAMLATLGVVVAEGTTGVAWQDAGKVELDGASYLGLGLPFTVTCALLLSVPTILFCLLPFPEISCTPTAVFDSLAV